MLLSDFPRSSFPVCKCRAMLRYWKCAQQGAATATWPKLLGGFQQICHVCTVSEAHPVSAGFWKSCTEQVLPGSVRNQRQKYGCLMSNIPRHKLSALPACHAQQAGSPCSANGANRMNTCHMSNTTLAALSCSVATAKTTATVQNISKGRYYLKCWNTTYLILLLWDFSKIEECPIFGIALGVSSQWNNENKS